MQIKRIKCPNCNAVLQVKNSKSEPQKEITCPRCQTILLVKFKPQQEPIEAHTFVETPHMDSGTTQLGNAPEGSTQLGGNNNGSTQLGTSSRGNQTALLVFKGHSYPLNEGQNIVGRKANTSTASIQIDTPDRYMSRQHCSIVVTTLADGTKKAVLSNYQNKNQTSVDNMEIETNDKIRLIDGNHIKMGETTVIFKVLNL